MIAGLPDVCNDKNPTFPAIGRRSGETPPRFPARIAVMLSIQSRSFVVEVSDRTDT
jgi:hypothetical protein